MLTPAEELGLSGMNLTGRVRTAFASLAPSELRDLCTRIREECQSRHVVYMRDGNPDPIRLLPVPITMLPEQSGYLHYVSLTIHNALKRLPDLYMQDFAVRQTLKLTEDEEKWLWDAWGPSHQESNPIFGRLDAVMDFSSPMWKNSLLFVEPNMSGIGGLHLVPTSEQILRDVVFPVLTTHDSRLQLGIGPDIRELLVQEMLDHLEVIGRVGRTVCFVEPRFATSGIDEQEDVARHFYLRHDLKVLHADPRELTIHKGEVCFEGTPIDIAYRDYTVLDMLELEKQGHDVRPMRQLFRKNQVVSSIAAELDQKACWEVLTDRNMLQKYFSAEERQVFRRHILWTRTIADRTTGLPDGHDGDLLDYIRREQETLVIKPNRSYGGEGVLLGLAVSEEEWEAAIETAVNSDRAWVVQQMASIPVREFPVIDEDGQAHFEPFYLVMGFAPTRHGVAIMGRASQKQVVNVARRGGLCAMAIGRPPAQLVGPEGLG
ncbi:MAG: hypothetical protein O2856_03865 [Planctomycetota bacterium]|nr:hypothetical protein [Planctomycetota bacterium]